MDLCFSLHIVVSLRQQRPLEVHYYSEFRLFMISLPVWLAQVNELYADEPQKDLESLLESGGDHTARIQSFSSALDCLYIFFKIVIIFCSHKNYQSTDKMLLTHA